MKTRKQIVLSLALVGASLIVVAAFMFAGGEAKQEEGAGGHNHAAMTAASGDELRSVRLDPDGARRIGVTYATVMRKPFTRRVSTVGNVTWDETRLANVNPKIEGWIERLYVDFTGAPVRRGQPLLAIYSPMLVSAQEELILARRLTDEAAAAGGERATTNARDLLESARRRLRYWDIPEATIRRVEETGTPQKTVVLEAPASGVVVEKMAVEGARIMPGMDVYRIADLSRVWVEGEVFEKDLSLVRIGQGAGVTFEAYPGEVFTGTVTYVYPTVSVEARTGRIRIELDNPGLRIKPGMYAKIALEVGQEGRTALMIPRSAVHVTGERSLVFVRSSDGLLQPHEVTTGLIAGDEVEVLAGLAEGDVVVTSANFLIDAEANMGSAMEPMNDEADGAGTAADHSTGAAHGAPTPTTSPSSGAAGHSGH